MRHDFSENGFTLMEALISAGIVLFVGGAVFLFSADVFSRGEYFKDALIAEHEGRTLLRHLTAELRAAAPAENGAYPLSVASPTEIRFYSDADDDGVMERIRYFQSGTEVRKGILIPTGSPGTYVEGNETVETVLRNVVNDIGTPVFSYYDGGYDGTTAPLSFPVSVQNVRLVQASFVLDADTSAPHAALLLTTQVSIRNLKDNL